MSSKNIFLAPCSLLCLGVAAAAWGHGVAGGDAAYLKSVSGVHFLPLMYLGAKHMVTGYDHLLFLAGVIFFLYRLKDVALYATLFRRRPQLHAVTRRAGRDPCEFVCRRRHHRRIRGL